MKNLKRIGLLFFLTIMFLFFIQNISINADSNDINSIPNLQESGPSVNGNYSINGKSQEQIYNKYNNVQIVSDGSKSNSQSMWWKNKINVMRPFTIKFYAYIAPTQQTKNNIENSINNNQNPDPPGDGITFTLQNDSNTSIGDAGQSLGVYGKFNAPDYYSGKYVRNALSYEFDPYKNSDGSDAKLPSNIGTGLLGQHTAFTDTVPGGHGKISGNSNGRTNYQKHYDVRPLTDWGTQYGISPSSSISDLKSWFFSFSAMWHKFIYTWNPVLPPNGDQKEIKNGIATVRIDDSNIIQQRGIPIRHTLNATNANPYVWWGFTGATGANSMIAAIADTEVTGDPGITKLVLNLSKLSDDDKKKIDDKIRQNASDYNDDTLAKLQNCIDNPSDSSSDPDLSNKLVKIIDSVDPQLFHSMIGSDDSNNPKNSNVGDVLLYKVSIYNYKVPDQNGWGSLGNSWNDITVQDDLNTLGMKSLDNKDNISAKYDTIPATDIDSKDSGQQPSSVGLRTIITSKENIKNPRSNTVTATGSNFLNNSINGANVNRSSEADVYVNPNSSNILPRIVADNKITDITQKETSENNTINNVFKNDQIEYDINLNNIVEHSQTDAGSSYSFWVPSLKNNNVDNISVNNNPISNNPTSGSPYYKVTDNYQEKNNKANMFGNQTNKWDKLNGSSKKLITIYNLQSISHDNPIHINANITLGNHNPTNFSSYPIFNDYKYNSGEGMYYIQKQETYNFSPGSLGFNYIRDIDYGLNSGYLVDGFIPPLYLLDKNNSSYEYHVDDNNGKYSIAQIHDSRVIKTPYSVRLSQVERNPTGTTIGTDSSPFLLKYFDNGKQHNISPITDISLASSVNSSIVYKSDVNNSDNNDIESDINWDKNNELKLGGNKKFNVSSNHSTGTDSYNAKLNWTFNNAPN